MAQYRNRNPQVPGHYLTKVPTYPPKEQAITDFSLTCLTCSKSHPCTASPVPRLLVPASHQPTSSGPLSLNIISPTRFTLQPRDARTDHASPCMTTLNALGPNQGKALLTIMSENRGEPASPHRLMHDRSTSLQVIVSTGWSSEMHYEKLALVVIWVSWAGNQGM